MLIMLPPAIVSPGLGQTPSQVQQMISNAAAGYNIPNLANVAAAVASHESGFQPGAQNPGSSAAGVFQLISSTQTTLGVSNPFDAQQNVNAGVGLLAQYYNQYGNWPDALQAFSEGPGTIGSPPSSQTQGLIAYVQSYGGLDLSPTSTTFNLPSFSLPDLSSFSISDALGLPGSPDWLVWLVVGLAAFGVVAFMAQPQRA